MFPQLGKGFYKVRQNTCGNTYYQGISRPLSEPLKNLPQVRVLKPCQFLP